MRDHHTARPNVETQPPKPAADSWSVVGSLLDDALDLPRPRRSEFADQACAGDEALRMKLNGLLAACERAERGTGFLDGPAGEFAEPVMVQLSAHVEAAALTVPADLEIALGERYTLEREVGRGGMAVVYLAQDFRIGRRVAVKVLKPDLAMALGQERFIREIRTVASLTHPHIVPLLDTGEIAATVYFTMPFVEGESLRAKLDHEPQLPLDTALGIAAQVADALDCAHRHNIVHRDIKPDNILLEEGHAVVADFGVARAIARAGGEELEEKLTATGVTFGTPAYMSPEQASGDRAIDGRSDIYSLGAVLYEMLAGEPPYRASSTAALITKILTFPVPSLQIDRPGLPDAVDQLVERCLAKAPADRFETAAELRDALRGVGSGGAAKPEGTSGSPAVHQGSSAAEATKAPAARSATPSTQQGEPPAQPRTRIRRWIGEVLAAGILPLLLLSGAAWSVWPRVRDRVPIASTASALSDSRIAVFPFVVHAAGDSADYLSEAVMDLLSGAIDGVGELRRVDPRSVMSALRRDRVGMTETMSLEDARRISKAFGARRFVLGTATIVGDRVHLAAALYDARQDDQAIAQSRRDGRIEDLSALVTEIARELLAGQAVGSGIRMSSFAAVKAASHAAERAYLEGEAMMRRGAYDSASTAMQRAVQLDSAFALAWFRLAWAQNMSGLDGRRSIDVAMEHRHALSRRDRLLAAAYHALMHGDGDLLERNALIAAGEYPDHVEAWYLLALARGWHRWQRGGRAGDVHEPQVRALALEPDNKVVLHMLHMRALRERRFADADSLRRLAYPPGGSFARSNALILSETVIAFGQGDDAAQRDVLARLQTGDDFNVRQTAEFVAATTDSLAGARRVAEILTRATQRSSDARTHGHLVLGLIELASGRRRIAREALAEAARGNPELALSYEAWFAAVPALRYSRADLDAICDSLVRWVPSADPAKAGPSWLRLPKELDPFIRSYLLGLVHGRLNEGDSALRQATLLEQADLAADSAGLAPDLALEIRALVLAEKGDTAAALALLERMTLRVHSHYHVRSSALHRRQFGRFLRAELLAAVGRDTEALGWYDGLAEFARPGFVLLAPAYLAQARLHERRGERELAKVYYRRFIDRWKDADAELQPAVAEAKARLAALARTAPRKGGRTARGRGSDVEPAPGHR